MSQMGNSRVMVLRASSPLTQSGGKDSLHFSSSHSSIGPLFPLYQTNEEVQVHSFEECPLGEKYSTTSAGVE